MASNCSEQGSLLLNLTTSFPDKNKAFNQARNKNASLESRKPPASSFQGKNKFGKKIKNVSQSPTKKSKDSSAFNHSSGQENVHISSLFKSNPEVHPLFVQKQNAPSETLFSAKTFEELNLHPHLVSCIKSRLNVIRMTKVQEKSIPVLLAGDDALIKSSTGSGKTLAYAVPIVQKLQEMNPKIKRSDGVYALVIVPTRELALQCFSTFSTLTKAFTWIVPGYLIGGEKKKSEKARLRKGINILIITPGRLLDHLDTTACLSLKNISWLVIDEADKLLEQKFEVAVKAILSKCNETRQSVLLSATLSKEVEYLAGVSLTNPVHIDIANIENNSDFQDFVIPANLKQFVVVVPSKLRLATLSGFIVGNCLKGNFKALIFMCSQGSVDFHYAIFSGVLTPLLADKGNKCKFFKLHGSMKQEERTEIFNIFRTVREGVMLCTDVGARGLDLPYVDWIVQYSAPSHAELYVHRVGRTARIGKRGSSLLFLLPSESQFSHFLAENKIDFDETTCDEFLKSLLLIAEQLSLKSKITPEQCATALQLKYENEIYTEKVLYESAKAAFASYVQAYATYPNKQMLPFKALHLGHVAKSFCLREAPSSLSHSVFNKKKSNYTKKSGDFRRSENSKPIKKNVHTFKSDSKPMKRKLNQLISEFDNGLSYMTSGRKAKKKKTH